MTLTGGSKPHLQLREAEQDVLAYLTFPREYWTRIYSTNPLERLNREVKRRTKVVQIFPDEPSVIRLVGALSLEVADEWALERRYFSQTTMRQLFEKAENLLAPARALAPCVD